MIVINKNSYTKIYWKIFRGENKVSEDFHSINTELKVFLVGPCDKRLITYNINRSINPGYDVVEIDVHPNTLSEGVYDLRAIWWKNKGRDLMTSNRCGIFGITDSSEEAPVEDLVEIKIASYTESFGRDGMSAYEAAVMYDLHIGITSEREWVMQETIRIENEDIRKNAEEGRITAEISRKNNENSRVSAEEVRERKEYIRDSNELVRISNESGRQSAEGSRKSSEEDREASEQERYINERGRMQSEKARMSAESARVASEGAREEAESKRKGAESSRETAEAQRVSAFNINEEQRKKGETSREAAEAQRVEAEKGRAAAEAARQATFTTNEESRKETFDTNEAKREAEFDAAIQSAKDNLIVVNDLTTGGADKALSAEMGKELQYQFFGMSRYIASPYTSFKVNVTKGGWRSVPITLSSGIHKILIRRGEISGTYPLYVNIFAGETKVGDVVIPVNIEYAQIQMSSAEPVDRIAFYCGKDEQVTIEIEKSVAELVPSTELQTSISEHGKFFDWSAGKEVATTTKTEILRVDVQGLKNIHALLYNVDIGSASIAFIDEDGVFMQDSSVRSVDTKGIPMWFWADVPAEAKTAILTNRYDTGHTPVVVTIDPTVKSAVEHEIDELKLGKSILYSRAESPVSTSISFNPLPIDITKYINGILYLDVKELSSTDGFIGILNADGIYLYKADIKSTGTIYIQVPSTASKMLIYKPASNNNILNFELGKLTGIYPNKGEGYGYMHNINSEVVTADEIKNGMFLGYYSVGQFTGSIVSSAKYWACTRMEFSNGYTVEFDTDWSVYQLEIGIIQPDFVKQSTSKTSAFSLDTTGLIGWCVQIRRNDYKTLTVEEAKSALSLTIVGSKKFERPASIPYVNSKIKGIAEELGVSDIKRNVSSISRQTIDSRKYPLLTSKWYHHMFMGSITKDRQSIIPAQSVFDVALASKLGFKVIELNVLVTSDGIPVTGHQVSVDGQAGYLGTLRTLDGTAVNVHIPSTTFATLRSDYVYNSKYPQYSIPITSLEEALRACAEYDVIPLVQIANNDTYTLVEGIMGKNYIAYNGSRTETDVMISGYPSGTVDELVTQCEKVGAPYFLCVSLGSVNAMTDSEIKELLTRAHALGCMVGHAGNYHSVMENQRYNKLGMDLVASGWDVPDFSESNEKLIVCNSVKGFSDIGKTTGTLSDGETISVQSPQQSIIAKASLHIHYKGTVQISFGRYISNVELTSDGASEVVQTSIIDDASSDLTIKSVGDAEIYSMSYRVASVI